MISWAVREKKFYNLEAWLCPHIDQTVISLLSRPCLVSDRWSFSEHLSPRLGPFFQPTLRDNGPTALNIVNAFMQKSA